MTAHQDERPGYVPIFVARQPIYDKAREVWGFELLFRHSGEASTAQITNQSLATSRVIADGFSLAMAGAQQDQKALINFPSQLLAGDAALALSNKRCVVEIMEIVEPTPEVLAACRRLKRAGYVLALDDYVGQPEMEPLLGLADIVKIDVLELGTSELPGVAQHALKGGRRLLAEKVEGKDEYERCRGLGFTLFQGFLFSRPEIVPGRTIPPADMTKIQLMGALTRRSIEIDELAEIVSHDVSLSYRLLTFINCSAFSFRTKIKTIGQAVALLGLEPFRQWALIVALTDFSNTSRGRDLTFLSLQRARFLEQVSQESCSLNLTSQAMFLLGLFSKLDVLLDQDMCKIVEHMDLDEEIAQALCGTRNRVHKCLDLLDAVESGQWDAVDALVAERHMSPATCAGEYMQAAAWAGEILGHTAP